jgi:AraC-like DNA-binding protein
VNKTDTPRSSYRELPVPPALSHILRLAWRQDVATGGGVYRQRVLPDGHADLMVDDQGNATVVGPASAVALPELAPGTRLRGLRLAFASVGPLFRVPAVELADQVVPLSALLPDSLASAVTDAMLSGDPVAERVPGGGWAAGAPPCGGRAAVAELRAWLFRAEPDARVSAAVRELWRRPGVAVNTVAERVGLSERQLRRALRADVGLGPKAFQRVGRLQRFLRLAAADPGRGLAALAADAGYADQPHLSREAKELAGLTATDLIAYHLGDGLGDLSA